MSLWKSLIPAAALALTVSVPALAEEQPLPVAHAAIMQGDYEGAERALRREARFNPDRAEIKLNLAAVMLQTGRYAEARALYDAVLAGPDAAMELSAGRVVNAHVIARVGRARADMPERRAIAAR